MEPSLLNGAAVTSGSFDVEAHPEEPHGRKNKQAHASAILGGALATQIADHIV